ncbi:hypothetical protein CLU79DRAFT_721732 [Phycomyces nitens]|nr:hypothetical protein CLU79DRAFT_721732 [Phycomyces nitens]
MESTNEEPPKSSILGSGLSIFVPRHKRQSPSIASQSTVGSTDPPSSPWSQVSFDQLSTYARRASSTISILNNGAVSILNPAATSLHSLDPEEKEQRVQDRVSKVSDGVVNTLKLAVNDCSLGLYRVSDHIHRRVPRIVQEKANLIALANDVDTANLDISDVRKTVADMERIESFNSMAKMVKQSMAILADKPQK